MYIFVKVCLGSSYIIAVPDCNDTSSLEACNCIIIANSPVFITFYFRFRHWAFWTKLIATTRLKTFQYRLVWTCIHKKLIACHSPNFKICVGSRIILPVTLLQPTKTDDRKRSNWPPDVNQIVFLWPPRRSIWKFTAREQAGDKIKCLIIGHTLKVNLQFQLTFFRVVQSNQAVLGL